MSLMEILAFRCTMEVSGFLLSVEQVVWQPQQLQLLWQVTVYHHSIIICPSVVQDHLVAAIGGVSSFNIAAELAGICELNGPASFKMALFDSLAALTPRHLDRFVSVRMV